MSPPAQTGAGDPVLVWFAYLLVATLVTWALIMVVLAVRAMARPVLAWMRRRSKARRRRRAAMWPAEPGSASPARGSHDGLSGDPTPGEVARHEGAAATFRAGSAAGGSTNGGTPP